MDEIVAQDTLQESEKAALFARLRLACSFHNETDRMHCVEARLIAISTLGTVCRALIKRQRNMLRWFFSFSHMLRLG
jgi:hypothetical protein